MSDPSSQSAAGGAASNPSRSSRHSAGDAAAASASTSNGSQVRGGALSGSSRSKVPSPTGHVTSHVPAPQLGSAATASSTSSTARPPPLDTGSTSGLPAPLGIQHIGGVHVLDGKEDGHKPNTQDILETKQLNQKRREMLQTEVVHQYAIAQQQVPQARVLIDTVCSTCALTLV